MNRRNFLSTSLLSGVGLSLYSCSTDSKQKKPGNIRGTFSMDKNSASIFTKSLISPTKIYHITDTHLSMDDERGIIYEKYSMRMAGAYKQNANFQTGEMFTTKQSFEQTLKLAMEQKADFLALTGDIFSFPSLASVDWAFQKLKNTGIPFAYVAGNHDWHYEGMEGSSQQLRETWTDKHLKPMYQGNNPLYAAYDFNGIRFISIDDSTYEILPEQLDFFKEQVKSKYPLVLLMHIPLYMPGRPMGFGCANPNWGEKSDKNYQIERREKWPKEGHTKISLDFYNEVFNAPNLLTILTGHTHRPSLDVKNGITQLVSGHNATGNYSKISIETMP